MALGEMSKAAIAAILTLSDVDGGFGDMGRASFTFWKRG